MHIWWWLSIAIHPVRTDFASLIEMFSCFKMFRFHKGHFSHSIRISLQSWLVPNKATLSATLARSECFLSKLSILFLCSALWRTLCSLMGRLQTSDFRNYRAVYVPSASDMCTRPALEPRLCGVLVQIQTARECDLSESNPFWYCNACRNFCECWVHNFFLNAWSQVSDCIIHLFYFDVWRPKDAEITCFSKRIALSIFEAIFIGFVFALDWPKWRLCIYVSPKNVWQ